MLYLAGFVYRVIDKQFCEQSKLTSEAACTIAQIESSEQAGVLYSKCLWNELVKSKLDSSVSVC